MRIVKGIALRLLIILVGWFATAITGNIPIFIYPRDIPLNMQLIERAESGYEIFTIWCAYRLGSRILKFPAPRGVVRTLINIAWAFLCYVIVGGTVEVAVGHPTLAAGLAGIPFSVAVYVLAARHKPPNPNVAPAPPTPTP